MEKRKRSQTNLDKGFKSNGFPFFSFEFQKFCHRLSIFSICKETPKKSGSSRLFKVKRRQKYWTVQLNCSILLPSFSWTVVPKKIHYLLLLTLKVPLWGRVSVWHLGDGDGWIFGTVTYMLRPGVPADRNKSAAPCHQKLASRIQDLFFTVIAVLSTPLIVFSSCSMNME